MAQKYAYLFLHGGPGLNSNPEKHLIYDRFRSAGLELHLWNEPSRFRDSTLSAYDFPGWLLSAENHLLSIATDKIKVCILAHSYGTQAAIYLSQKFPHLIDKIIFITPAFAMHHCDMKIFEFCNRDFIASDPESAVQMEKLIRDSVEEFDDVKIKAWNLVLGNPLLATHYFNDVGAMQAYFGFLTGTSQIDMNSLLGVRRTEYHFPISERSNIETVLFFGADDEIIDMDLQIKVCKNYFRNITSTVLFNRSKHFLHLEEPDKFLSELQNITKNS